MNNYLTGRCNDLELDYEFVTGTDFEKSVWRSLSQVKYGDTISYKKPGEISGYPYSARAVVNAMSKNFLVIILSCHRVVKSDGTPGGFSGGLQLKKIY